MGQHRSTEQLLEEAEKRAARLRERQSTERNRRLLLIGVAMEQWASDDPDRQETIRKITEQNIKARHDRKFLGLPIEDRQTE